MNGIERFRAILNGDRADRVPIRIGNYNVFLTKYYDISIRDYVDNPDLNAQMVVKMVREFDFDSLKAGMGYIFYGCGPEVGTQWIFPEDGFPVSNQGVIQMPDDLEKTTWPIYPEGYFAKFLEINRQVKIAVGHEKHLGVSILGPFSVMAFMRGYETLLMDMIDSPSFFSRMMEKGEALSTYIGQHCLELGLHWANLMEIFLVPGMLDPEIYHRAIAPHSVAVSRQLANPPIANSYAPFMGIPGDRKSHRNGARLYKYYFGTEESIDLIRSVADMNIPAFPKLVSISGNALVHLSIADILAFVKNGVDFFVKEKATVPCIFLASLQAESSRQAKAVAEKLRAITDFRDSYVL